MCVCVSVCIYICIYITYRPCLNILMLWSRCHCRFRLLLLWCLLVVECIASIILLLLISCGNVLYGWYVDRKIQAVWNGKKAPQGCLWDLSLCMVSDEEEEGVGCKRWVSHIDFTPYIWRGNRPTLHAKPAGSRWFIILIVLVSNCTAVYSICLRCGGMFA